MFEITQEDPDRRYRNLFKRATDTRNEDCRKANIMSLVRNYSHEGTQLYLFYSTGARDIRIAFDEELKNKEDVASQQYKISLSPGKETTLILMNPTLNDQQLANEVRRHLSELKTEEDRIKAATLCPTCKR